VLTCTGVQYAILCLKLVLCLRMLQNNFACFQGICLFFVQLDMFVLLWSASLSEDELMIWYKSIILNHSEELL
jgi:hypothetical protein